MKYRTRADRGFRQGITMKKLITILALLASAGAFAHSGGTDSTGCHVDSRTGVRHCH